VRHGPDHEPNRRTRDAHHTEPTTRDAPPLLHFNERYSREQRERNARYVTVAPTINGRTRTVRK
jgi:hypothetical protein